jgi:excisionase family DNA binding protein
MEEAARIKGVSYHTVSRAVRKGKLAATRNGRMVLISRDDLANWTPMRERAPHRYQRRAPEPDASQRVIDLASGERIELARRISALIEAMQTSAIIDPSDAFAELIAERIAVAMGFSRVAIWIINRERSEIELAATYGNWFAPGEEPRERIWRPYDPETMYIVGPAIYPGIHCWVGDPAPVRMNEAFSTSLIAKGLLHGYIIGDHDGAPFSLTQSQLDLGRDLATQAGLTIELRRGRDLDTANRTADSAATEFAPMLTRLSHAINHGNELISIIRQASRDACRVTGSHIGGAILATEHGTITCYLCGEGIDHPPHESPVALNAFTTITNAHAAGGPHISTWADANEIERTFWLRSETRSLLTVPLEVHGELIGGMIIAFREEFPKLSTEQIAFCEAMAASCVTAIIKDQLLKQLAAMGAA